MNLASINYTSSSNNIGNPQCFQDLCSAVKNQLQPDKLLKQAGQILLFNMLPGGNGLISNLFQDSAVEAIFEVANGESVDAQKIGAAALEGMATTALVQGCMITAQALMVPLPLKLLLLPCSMVMANTAIEIMKSPNEPGTFDHLRNINAYGWTLLLINTVIFCAIGAGAAGSVGVLKAGIVTQKNLQPRLSSTPALMQERTALRTVHTQRRVHETGEAGSIRYVAYTHEGISASRFENSHSPIPPNGDAVLVWMDELKNTWMAVADGVSGSLRGDEAARLAIEGVYQHTLTNPRASAYETIRIAQENIEKAGCTGTTTLMVAKMTPGKDYGHLDYALVGDGKLLIKQTFDDTLREIFPENPELHRYKGKRGDTGQLGGNETVLIGFSEFDRHSIISNYNDVAVRHGTLEIDPGDRWMLTTDGMPGMLHDLAKHTARSDETILSWSQRVLSETETRQNKLWEWSRKGPHSDRLEIAPSVWVEQDEFLFHLYDSPASTTRIGQLAPDNLGVVFGEYQPNISI